MILVFIFLHFTNLYNMPQSVNIEINILNKIKYFALNQNTKECIHPTQNYINYTT